MTKRIFVAGHNGMVGRAIVRQLKAAVDCEIITRNRAELDLLSQSDVRTFFKDAGIDQVYLAAAKVGGIQANNNFFWGPAAFTRNLPHSLCASSHY
jgi:GDP-L-fucose synthase